MPPQKGLSRTLVRFKSREEELAAARASIKRWWWEYLRLSQEYWMVCKFKGHTLDPHLRRVWERFGEIHNTTFDEWWLRKGSRVFGEQDPLPKVRLLEENQTIRPQARQDRVFIEVPLVLRQATAQRQIGRILKAALSTREFSRPRNVLETSTAEFRINPVLYRLEVLKKTHEVWCAHRELVVKPKLIKSIARSGKQDRVDLFQLGKKLNLSPSNALISDNYDIRIKRQNRMRATVSRYIRRANLLIYHVARGNFPVQNALPKTQLEIFPKSCLRKFMNLDLEQEWLALDLKTPADV
jgi:hypothetical protein